VPGRPGSRECSGHICDYVPERAKPSSIFSSGNFGSFGAGSALSRYFGTYNAVRLHLLERARILRVLSASRPLPEFARLDYGDALKLV
jgi:hypothetical protein